MRTFFVQTLGCKVNQYEGEQVAAMLRARGLRPVSNADAADLRVVNTCSVTVQAASQSRQTVRRVTRSLLVLNPESCSNARPDSGPADAHAANEIHPSSAGVTPPSLDRPRVVVIGCWATGDKEAAAAIRGVDAVFTHQDNLAAELDRLLTLWLSPTDAPDSHRAALHPRTAVPPRSMNDNGWIREAWTAGENRTTLNKPKSGEIVNEIPAASSSQDGELDGSSGSTSPSLRGARSLPILGAHQSGRQRAFLKVQDGCDAHCTYCIIPQLRPTLWSKPAADAVEEARRLLDAGHVEIVLTGIFLGAYGQPTALRRRQPNPVATPLAGLVEALCTRVPGLNRLRLSSLEPGDLSQRLLKTLAAHPQVVPHFHLPLQSGSDRILRLMNRQYRRDDFLQMVERLRAAFDRPALTTDVIVGFPDEDDGQFQHTVDVVRAAGFIHIHAFPYSPRPGTAAARWGGRFVRGPVVNDRLSLLAREAAAFSYAFRRGFVGSEVDVIAEAGTCDEGGRPFRQGRCERYFQIRFESPTVRPGDAVRLRVDRVTEDQTYGTPIGGGGGGAVP